MRTNLTTEPARTSRPLSVAVWTTRLVAVGIVGWLWFLYTAAETRPPARPAAVLALAAVSGLTWWLVHVRSERRWRAVLDRYADHELAVQAQQRRAPGPRRGRGLK
jgi:hypothetical protein